MHGRHLGGLDPVFASQGIDGVQPLLQLLQARRVRIEMVDEAIQFADGLFDLDLRAGQQVGGFRQGAGGVADARQAIEAHCQGAEDVTRIAFAAMLDDLPADAQQAFGIGQVLVFEFQLLEFVFAQGEVLQFLQLIAEKLVASPLFIPGIGQALQLLAGLAPVLGSQRYLAGQVGGAGVLVEQAAVGVGFQQ